MGLLVGAASCMLCCQGVNEGGTLGVFADLLVWKAEESGSENWGQIFGPNMLREISRLNR